MGNSGYIYHPLVSSRSLSLFSFQRPLFVLADRNLDLATPLHHTWTYQALIHVVVVRLTGSQGIRGVGGMERSKSVCHTPTTLL